MTSIVANNIKYLRRMNGLTQEQFARKIGIKRSLLGAYEEGRANPNLENLKNIAKIFGTTVDNLIKNDIRGLREKEGIPLPLPAEKLLEPVEPQPLASLIDKYYQKPADIQSLPAEQLSYSTYERSENKQPAAYIPEPLRASVPLQQPAAKNGKKTDLGHVWVPQSSQAEYLTGYAYEDYLETLPSLQLPTLPSGKYRAFQTGDDFPMPGSTVIGEFVSNWFDIQDGAHYMVVVHKQGVLYRRIYNHVKIKGTILLLSDSASIPTIEVSIKDVLELWEARQYIGLTMPEPKASLPLEHLLTLTVEMQREIEKLQKGL